jgi:LDH2 family malate/lactate/ureidoglycolate dehydrogenase
LLSKDEKLISVKELQNFCSQCFERLGLSPADAQVTAEGLVAANLRGVDSHGVIRLKVYTDRIRAGGTKLDGQPRTIQEGDSFALLDGDANLGQVISAKAMRLAIEKARVSTIAVVAVRNSSHFGAAAFYGLMAAQAGMIGVATTNSGPFMSPTGGAKRMLGNNPLCVAIPAGRFDPIVLDMATGAVALGTILSAMMDQRRIPLTWGVDAQGRQTDDPKAVVEGGSILPLGGHKGYGLSLIIDVLTGLLTGGEFLTSVRGLYRSPQNSQGVSHLFLALRIESFMPLTEFKQRMDEMISALRECPRAPNVERIYVPGEIEQDTARVRLEKGIPLGSALVDELKSLAHELEVEIPASLT